MSERKVLNKYYPPDFDPTKLPRLRLAKNRQFNVRIMAPCNMKCTTCGEYIYKGKKFNSRQETVEGESYLGLRVFRFYIKCTRCMSEITFKTNLEEMDYELEHGATRNFQAVRLAEQEAERVEEARVEEEKSNPMIALERRTQDSRHEMDRLEALEELKDLNMRQANVNYEEVIKMTVEKEIQALREQEETDEAFVRSVFSHDGDPVIKRLRESDSDEDGDDSFKPGFVLGNPSDLISEGPDNASTSTNQLKKPKLEKPALPWEKSVGAINSRKHLLSNLVRAKPQPAQQEQPVKELPSSSSLPSTSSASGLGFLAYQYGSSSDEDG